MLSARLRKYKMTNSVKQALGIPRKAFHSFKDLPHTLNYERKTHLSVRERLLKNVKDFYSREDISRITTGKHDTKSTHGIKVQRRLLTDSMRRLHIKYMEENPEHSISFSLFCTMKPHFVVRPTIRDRETCLCRLHENGRLIVEKLSSLKRLPSGVRTVDACVDAAICFQPTRGCFERKCDDCKNNMNLVNSNNNDDTVDWHKWATIKEERIIKGKSVTVQRCIKQTKSTTQWELEQEFVGMLPKLCWHIMVMRHQYKAYHEIKEKDTCTVVIDFSENFTCGANRAIQSSHFGASNRQITLHTGVAYTKNKTLSFCSISNSTRHDPAAISAHLEPTISYIKAENPDIECINFWSDGPVTQYRNKKHFATVSQIQQFGLMSGCTWNFTEAGHGKGAADSIGGVIERLGDAAINTGSVIEDAESFIDVVCSRTKVKLFLITENMIDSRNEYLEKFVIKSVPGTMKVHQLQTIKPGVLSIRDLSCFCSIPKHCDCLGARQIVIRAPEATIQAHANSTIHTPQVITIMVPQDMNYMLSEDEQSSVNRECDNQQPSQIHNPTEIQHSYHNQQPSQIHKPTEIQDSCDTQQPSQIHKPTEIQQSCDNQQPSDLQKSTEIQQSCDNQQPSEIQKSTEIQQSCDNQQPSDIQKSTEIQQSWDNQQPSGLQKSTEIQQSCDNQQPSGLQKSTEIQQSCDNQQPSQTQKPVEIQHSYDNQQPSEIHKTLTELQHSYDKQQETVPHENRWKAGLFVLVELGGHKKRYVAQVNNRYP